MEINEFITNFADQFDDTDASEITAETSFRDLDEWSSLIGLAVMNMISKKYGKKISATELKSVQTVRELFDLVNGK